MVTAAKVILLGVVVLILAAIGLMPVFEPGMSTAEARLRSDLSHFQPPF
jgi:hypothetical protein